MRRISCSSTLFESIVEDAISIRLVGDADARHQAQVLSRTLLGRITN